MGALLVAVTAACNGGGGDPDASPLPARDGAATTSTAPACRDGGRSFEEGGVRVHEFCGPAQAAVSVAERDLHFTGGSCIRRPESFELHLGREIVEPQPGRGVVEPRFPSFSLLMGRHRLGSDSAVAVGEDGTFNHGTLTFAVPGASFAADDLTVTLLGSRTSGVFTGSGFATTRVGQRLPLEGAFTCDATNTSLDSVRASVETEPGDEEPPPENGNGESGGEAGREAGLAAGAPSRP